MIRRVTILARSVVLNEQTLIVWVEEIDPALLGSTLQLGRRERLTATAQRDAVKVVASAFPGFTVFADHAARNASLL